MKKLFLIAITVLGLTVTHRIIAQNITANFSATSVCLNNPTCFTDLSTSSPYSITNWNWNFGDNSPINTAQNPCHTYSLAGTYTVTLIVTNSNADKDTASNLVTVYPLPNGTFTSTTVCEGNSTCFYPFSNNAISWSWNFGDSTGVSNLEYPCHTYLNGAGTYNVALTITSQNGCQITTILSTTVIICTGINTLSQNGLIKIFPNPFSTHTTLHTDKFFNNSTLSVYNLYGQQVKRIENLSGQTIIFHRDNLPSGLYFIRLSEAGKIVTTEKLVITDN